MDIFLNKKLPTTAVTRDLGFRLTLKLVLYLKVQSLTEYYGVLSPKPRVAAKRWASVWWSEKTHVKTIQLKKEL